MKDIVLTGRRQKKELWYLLGSFVIANLFNLGAILYYGSPMTEMFTSFFYVLLFTLLIYALTLIPRLLYNMLKKKAHTEVKN